MMRIFLIGYMGAGKTTLGKALAKKINFAFVDTDFVIESRCHQQIGEIFASEGEARFREIESELLYEISGAGDAVIATGGGLPCFNDNMTVMNEAGVTVYMDVSVEELAARLETCKETRPVLQNRSGAALVEFVRENLEKRRPYYEQAAVRFDAGNMLTDKDVERLVKELDALIKTEI